MCEKTKSMQTGPKREYVMVIMADNQGTINCDEWWTNLLFLLNILNGITKQTHSLFESCLSQNPFIFPFILNNYFRYPFWRQSRYLCANFNSRQEFSMFTWKDGLRGRVGTHTIALSALVNFDNWLINIFRLYSLHYFPIWYSRILAFNQFCMYIVLFK